MLTFRGMEGTNKNVTQRAERKVSRRHFGAKVAWIAPAVLGVVAATQRPAIARSACTYDPTRYNTPG